MADETSQPAKPIEASNVDLLKRLLALGLRSQGKFYAIGVAAMIVVASMSALTAWSMQLIVDTMTNAQGSGAGQVGMVSMVVIAIFAAKGLATYVQTVSMARAGNGIIAAQQRNIFAKLVHQGVDYFSSRESSDLLTQVTHSAQAARGLIDLVVTSLVRDLLTLIGLVAVMFYQQPTLSTVSLVIGPIMILGIRMILRHVRGIMSQQLTSMSEIIKVLQETSRGIRVVKIFSLEPLMIGRMNKAVGEVEKRANALTRLEAITSPLMETMSGVAIAGVVWLSAVNLTGGEPTSAGQLMSFVTALLMAYEPAKRLSKMRVTMEAQFFGVRMLFGLLDQVETMKDREGAKPLAVTKGTIRFDKVSFQYTDTGAAAVKDLDLVFEGGKMTALVGESGAGKSTIINLAMQLYNPTTGRVLIDEQDLRDVTSASVRKAMSFVGQDTFLFSASVIENIRASRPEASDDEVIAAARAAHAHEFITALPQGYQTHVGENGTFLSGGQRQRLAIARALLRQAAILVLDEATSALDSASEAHVKAGLAKASEGVTSIVIAHRLSTILRADRIYVLGQGGVLETGTAAELLARQGPFRKLYDQQFMDVVKSDEA